MNGRSLMTARGLATGLGGLGLAVSLYLMAAHYWQGTVPLACSSSGLVNCELVTSSRQSMVGPLPVALLGLVWCAVLLALLGLERRVAARAALATQLVWTGGGLGFVFYLLYSELFLIGAICLWCTVVHLAVAAVFLVTLFRFLDQPVTPRHPLQDGVYQDPAGVPAASGEARVGAVRGDVQQLAQRPIER